MTPYPIPPDEAERLKLLQALNLLDTPAEPAFDRITRLVAHILQVPIALVSLVDAERQWFKSRVGLETTETPRQVAFCTHAIMQSAPLIVEDATQDVRFSRNPLVTDNPQIRFYAGVPIRTSAGLAMGTLCAIDTEPRTLSQEEIHALIDLADIVSKEVQLRETILLTRSHLTHSEKTVQAVEARFRTVFERAGAGIALVAPDGGWLRVNDALCQIVGYSQEELAHMTFQDITHPDDLDSDLSMLQQLEAGEIESYELEKRYICKNGRIVWIYLIVTKQMNLRGELEYFVSIVKDIQARKTAESSLAALRQTLEERVMARTQDLHDANEQLSFAMAQQKHAEQVLRKREAELSMVIENANDAYVCIDDTGKIHAWNHEAERTFGWTAQEAMGQPLDTLIIPPHMREDHRAGMTRYLSTGTHTVLNKRIELPAMRRDGTTLPVEVRIAVLKLEGQTMFSAFLHDITERKQAEAIREHEARHDALTGLPNRRALFELLPQAIARANRNQKEIALLFIDLDGFKQINDTQGHEAGDAVLCAIAQRLRDNIRQTDTAARLGGDEFTVLLEGLHDGRVDALALAEKLLLQIQHPIESSQHWLKVSASIGIAIHTTDSTNTPDQLINAADAAMYEAKHAGKSRVCIQH